MNDREKIIKHLKAVTVALGNDGDYVTTTTALTMALALAISAEVFTEKHSGRSADESVDHLVKGIADALASTAKLMTNNAMNRYEEK